MSELSLIRDFLWIDEPWLATSGQPKPEQFAAIRNAGFARVVSLLPDDSEAYLPEEVAIVQDLGMAYDRIPVAWRNPTRENFDAFCEIFEGRDEAERIFVHCAANLRVSAFTYLWRVRRGDDESDALADLRDIWVPDGVWAEFIGQVRATI